MVVQAAVVTGGMTEVKVPCADLARRASRLGIRPRCRIGSSTVQVAPSRPRTTILSIDFRINPPLLGSASIYPSWIPPEAQMAWPPARGRPRSAGPGQRSVDVEREVRRIVLGDLVSFALGAIHLGELAPELRPHGEVRFGISQPELVAGDEVLR